MKHQNDRPRVDSSLPLTLHEPCNLQSQKAPIVNIIVGIVSKETGAASVGS